MFYILLPNEVPGIQCAFYIYSTSSFGMASFQVLSSHTWSVACELDGTDTENQSQTMHCETLKEEVGLYRKRTSTLETI